MTPTLLEAPVLQNEQIASDIYRLTLEAPPVSKLSAPGQFIMINGAENGQPLLRRPFSIHQATPDGKLQILFKKIGPGTTFLANKREGELLNILGPLGTGFSLPSSSENICIVGGGMGIAPLFYLAQEILIKSEQPNQLKVLLGSTTGDEIANVVDLYKNLGADVYISTDDGSAGHRGLVTDLLAEKLNQSQQWNILTCGPHPMMKGVVTFCREKDWPCQVSMETLMACGISACLGCAVRTAAQTRNPQEPYLHVCKDGPVFKAEELEWI